MVGGSIQLKKIAVLLWSLMKIRKKLANRRIHWIKITEIHDLNRLQRLLKIQVNAYKL